MQYNTQMMLYALSKEAGGLHLLLLIHNARKACGISFLSRRMPNPLLNTNIPQQNRDTLFIYPQEFPTLFRNTKTTKLIQGFSPQNKKQKQG